MRSEHLAADPSKRPSSSSLTIDRPKDVGLAPVPGIAIRGMLLDRSANDRLPFLRKMAGRIFLNVAV